MKNKSEISELSRSMIEIAWHFGPKGLNGECCCNLSLPEFIALDKISTTENCPVQEIGRELGFTKSGATRVVNRLEKKGYVKKCHASEDGRVCCVLITENGKNIIKEADAAYSAKFRELLKKMPESLSQKTRELFGSIAKVLKG
jgi:MarR family transcriptional regulator, organic hydroperoxide resistance regulator